MLKSRHIVTLARKGLLASRPTLRRSLAGAVVNRCLSSVPRPLIVDNNNDPHAEAWKAKKESLRLMLEKTKTAANQKELPTVKESPKNVDAEDGRLLSPSELKYTGDSVMPITSHLHIVKPGEDTPRGIWPVFRMMDENGEFRDGSTDGFAVDSSFEPITPTSLESTDVNTDEHELDNLRINLKNQYPFHQAELEASSLLRPSKHNYPDVGSRNTLVRAFRQMMRLREMDTILQNAQRQGRISFYMTCSGEEAIHIGSASALTLDDTILAQYREAGILMWRGFTLEQFTNQCFSNDGDLGKGRQMPVHYGSRALNYQTISSPLGTQIPQAAGSAYRLKLAGKKGVAVCYFGDGCTSTTDFHSGLNFAATLGAPVVFFCRNNGYAISTPVTNQYAGDGVVSRAPGYGMAAIRVDGNDVFAVHAATREARNYALRHNAPILVEAMTYRQGHHSTSDDSLRYRKAEEVQSFAEVKDPLVRFQSFLQEKGVLADGEGSTIRDGERAAVIDAMRQAESRPKPPLNDLFDDVYHELPPSLVDQQKQLHEHLDKYKGKY